MNKKKVDRALQLLEEIDQMKESGEITQEEHDELSRAVLEEA